MLVELYIAALLSDEELADQVWEALDRDQISVYVAAAAWSCIANTCIIYA